MDLIYKHMIHRVGFMMLTCLFPVNSICLSGKVGPFFTTEPQNEVVFPNDKGVLIPCIAHGCPAPTVDWVKPDGKTVDSVPGIVRVLANNSLQFPAFQPNDFQTNIHTAIYRCLATNSLGSVISRQVTVKAVLIEKYRHYNVQLNDNWVIRGSTAIFKCDIQPYFVTDYVNVTSWQKGSTNIHPNSKYSILSSGELHIRNVDTPDSQHTYRCLTRNTLTGETKFSQKRLLHVEDSVNSKPDIKNKMQTISVQHGSVAELPCVSTGFPVPTYSWLTESGRNVNISGRVRQRGGNLVIFQTSINDSTKYICVATNTLGRTEATRELIVTQSLSVIIDPVHQRIDAGRFVYYNCSIKGGPVKSVTWYKDGKPLVTNNRVILQSERRLFINSVERQDEGMYQCFASNDKESAQGYANFALGAAKPVFLGTFSTQFVPPNSKVSLRCVVTGNPIPTVSWTLDEGPIPNEPVFTSSVYTSDKGVVTAHLNISNIRVKDGGQYRCIANNIVDNVVHLSTINVYGKPWIRAFPNITAVAGRDLVVKCHVSGYPIQSITWYKGGSRLPINHRQHVRSGVLTIQSVERSSDAGSYTCIALNNQGERADKTIQIPVIEPPKIDVFRFPKKKKVPTATLR